MDSALSAGDGGHADDRKARTAEGRRSSGDGIPRRHQVVNDHHPRRPGRSDSLRPSDELARRRGPALGRGELSAVRRVGGQPEHMGDPGCDAAPPQSASRVPGQPLDVLATPASGDRIGGRNRDEQHRPAVQLGDGRRQRARQRPRQVVTPALLVREQACTHDAGVVRRNRHPRQTRRGGVRAMSPRPSERLPASLADGSTRGGATDASGREGQICQHGEHATTVPPSAGSR
ncbi:MAG TPA: hypothetical protein VH573_23690 [Mycobacteriales bacterium]|jgi:hypothetical protein